MPFSRPILRFTDDCRLKTNDLQPRCALRYPYQTGRSNSNGLLEQRPRSRDRRASARMALTATSPLRSTLIVTLRHSSAPTKSKPIGSSPYACALRILNGTGTPMRNVPQNACGIDNVGDSESPRLHCRRFWRRYTETSGKVE